MILSKKIFIIGVGGHGRSIANFFKLKKNIFFIDKKKILNFR